MQHLEGTVGVVTGAGSGIGAALVAGFVAEGMRVVAADIDGPSAQRTRDAHGDAVVAMQVDVADPGAMARFADDCFDRMGQVDVLCNNAGVFQAGFSWERSAQDWDWVMGVNVFGITNAIREFVPRMIAQDTEGHIVNTASVAAFVAGPMSGPYVVSKHAAFAVTECLALDLQAAGAKIGASVLTPSSFDTGISATARVRPEHLGTDATEDGPAIAQALASMTAQGQDPAAAVPPVLAAIRSGEFLIPTMPSYENQLRTRYDALLERRIPDMAPVD